MTWPMFRSFAPTSISMGNSMRLIRLDSQKTFPRVHVNQDHVRVCHGELAEAKLISAVCHVIAWLRCLHRTVPKGLHNPVSLNPDLRDTSFDVRRRQDLLRVEDQVISGGTNACNFFGADQICKLDAKQIHQSFHREVCRLYLVGMKPDLSFRRG